ncbi:hypothetical protein DERF_004333 [Dermatophagoides farinae]|uniref:Uncharacterized protein n=1 Tax=Dermatophagoides farinae TaxID=6954 RepID=A0A922I3P9_DERFA|nr:hypothetical protein DERF_004333 [Dermatophagoides farinae]
MPIQSMMIFRNNELEEIQMIAPKKGRFDQGRKDIDDIIKTIGDLVGDSIMVKKGQLLITPNEKQTKKN